MQARFELSRSVTTEIKPSELGLVFRVFKAESHRPPSNLDKAEWREGNNPERASFIGLMYELPQDADNKQ